MFLSQGVLEEMDTPLVILAGGRATRLGPLSEDRPKFLVDVGLNQRFADVQLAWASEQGFWDVVLSVGYRGKQIEEYCGDGSRYGVCLRYVYDGAEPLGTGGAVKRAFRRPPDRVAVLYGDTLLALDCSEVIRKAKRLGSYVLMTVLADPNEAHIRNAELRGDKVTYSKSAPKQTWRHIDYGFLVLCRAFIEEIPKTVPLDLSEPLERASAAGRCDGYLATEHFWEINTPEALAAFRRRFGQG